MRLSPREIEKLLLHYAGELAQKRRLRGVKLNAIESIALISMEIMELAREGRHSVAELMEHGRTILNATECLDGVASLVQEVQVEATFPDGTKLITIHNPIQGDGMTMIAGEIRTQDGEIELNANTDKTTLTVHNTGDRPIQVGSHFHFFEVNKALVFEREQAFGKRLDIASGTSVRFEPGDSKTITLVAFGGARNIMGFNDLTNGLINKATQNKALKHAQTKGFIKDSK